jgi:hypothetical protein
MARKSNAPLRRQGPPDDDVGAAPAGSRVSSGSGMSQPITSDAQR